MKYIVVLGDGMADRPIEELGGKTPLAYANTPMLDELAKVSEIGMVQTVPEGMSPGSDTANLSVLGYDPRIYYSGRSPLEALSIGVPMKDTDVAMRCNLVTLSEEEQEYQDRRMVYHSSGEISTEEASGAFGCGESGTGAGRISLLCGNQLSPSFAGGTGNAHAVGSASRYFRTEDRRSIAEKFGSAGDDGEKL